MENILFDLFHVKVVYYPDNCLFGPFLYKMSVIFDCETNFDYFLIISWKMGQERFDKDLIIINNKLVQDN
mgnify:CR=1 FL=1